jgi:hypothetical protein
MYTVLERDDGHSGVEDVLYRHGLDYTEGLEELGAFAEHIAFCMLVQVALMVAWKGGW